ncbi:ABC transporter permease [Geovibrio ferrireducens]|uniref:ABC transporter permease n=1 Tax=Geovibrio ferrireducens TaxID=46201 RepID=UPI0022472DA6|nr:ABC transporter permease [Geovibrio ferrireducens]
MRISPLTERRLRRFCYNRRAWYSLIMFSFLFLMSLCAEIIANDKPLIMSYNGKLYFPVLFTYTESEFGGFFDTEADYRDPFMLESIEENGWAVWTPVRYSYDTINYDTDTPPPTPPSLSNPLGLDDQGRDVFARLLYGFRLSVLFGFMLTLVTSVIGVLVGALQGYYGGRVDLWGQRFMEVWSGIPMLYLLILASSMIRPGFWWLLLLMSVFGWMSLVGVVRAEFLKGRELEYVQAARVLGVRDSVIMFRHILPNALVAAMTFLPFILSGSIGVLTSLDFLGFGMPPGSPSIGELLAAGKSNLHAPWLGISAFVTVSLMLSLLVFIGEGMRDALDPRYTGNRK